MPEVIQPIYVDEHQLDFYAGEFKVKARYDKVPVNEVGLSITGPKAQLTQQRFPRPAETSEKVRDIYSHLRKKGLLTTFPVQKDNWAVREFGEATVWAQRAVFRAENDGQCAIAVWICGDLAEPEKNCGRLYLLENRGRWNGQGFEVVDSAYSALQFMYGQVQRMLIHPGDPEPPLGGHELQQRISRSFRGIADNPRELVLMMGGKLSEPRKVWTLFAPRFGGRDLDIGGPLFPVTVLAYPIVIAAAH